MAMVNVEIPVGGDILDLAFSRAKPHARFVICGGKSMQLNAPASILTSSSYQPI
jgi:NADPH-dependent curcumin reductase CurA